MQQRLPKGTFKPLSEKANLRPDYLSALVSGSSKRPSRKTAQKLEQATSEIGKTIPAAVWLLASKEELRAAVLSMRA